MGNAIDLLVFDDGLNRKGFTVGKNIFRLGRGQFHLNTLLKPPLPDEQLSLNPEGTIAFLDYSRVGNWRRAGVGDPGVPNDPALPPWAQSLKFVYLIGLIVAVSYKDMMGCVEEIQADIPRFLRGEPRLARPQSAVLLKPADHILPSLR